MVRVKKRASKRVSTKQREKVHKKVREHHRKQRRDAKKNPQWKSRRREDPGIPNSFPFKEELLNEIEQKRRVAAEERMMRDDEEEEDEEEENEEGVPAPGFEEPLNLPFAPTLTTPLDDVLQSNKEIKALVYVVDARDPASFQSAWLEEQLTKKSPALVYVLSKADLVPAEVLTAWVYRLLSSKRPVFPVATPPSAAAAIGVDALAAFLRPKVRGGATAVIGLENAGKTSVATALQGAFQEDDGEEQVFDTPALLSSKTTLPVDNDDDEEDEEDEEEEVEEEVTALGELQRLEKERAKLQWLLARNQGNMQRFKDPYALIRTLLSRVAHPEDLMLIYGTPAFGSFVPAEATLSDDAPVEEAVLEKLQRTEDKAQADTEQFLIGVARSVGRLKRYGVPDILSAARGILRDWSQASIGYYAVPLDRQKLVEANGTKADKARWAEAQGKVDHVASAVLPRKMWRQQWNGRELRLKPLHEGPMAHDVLVFAPYEEDEEDEEDDDDDVPVYADDDEEDEDEDDDDDDDDDDEEEVDDEIDDDLDDDDDDDDDDLDDEKDVPAPPPKPAASKKRNAPPPKPAKSQKTAKRAPAPGEAYDLNAYF